MKIVDIQSGKATYKKDPYGNPWAVFDPLQRVGFYNPKEIEPKCQLQPPSNRAT